MSTAPFNKFQAFVANLANGAFSMNADPLYVMFTNVAPQPTNAIQSDITEITPSGGYASGGIQVLIASSAQVNGVYSLIPVGNVVISASGGDIGPFRWIVLYDQSAPAGALIGWYDFGQSVLVENGLTFTMEFNLINGIIQIT